MRGHHIHFRDEGTKTQRGQVFAQMDMEFRATEGSGLACLLCMWSCSELEGVVLCMGGGSPVLNLLAWAGSMKQGSEGG